MIDPGPLELALDVQRRFSDPSRPDDRRRLAEEAVKLADAGVFSTPHIIAITGLPKTFTEKLLEGKNSNRRGGALNVKHLDLIYNVWSAWNRGGYIDIDSLVTVIRGGTSPRMVYKLTGLHFNTIYKWMRRQV